MTGVLKEKRPSFKLPISDRFKKFDVGDDFYVSMGCSNDICIPFQGTSFKGFLKNSGKTKKGYGARQTYNILKNEFKYNKFVLVFGIIDIGSNLFHNTCMNLISMRKNNETISPVNYESIIGDRKHFDKHIEERFTLFKLFYKRKL